MIEARALISTSARRFRLTVVILGVLLAVAFITSFLIGRYEISISTVIDIFLSKIAQVEEYWDGKLDVVVLGVRLPRIILAILVGGALSVSGASYQTLFKNPLVSPDILGVSAGAGFGAALAMINEANWVVVQGCLRVRVDRRTRRIRHRQPLRRQVHHRPHTGAASWLSSLFQAMLSIVKTLADTENQLPPSPSGSWGAWAGE